jgi:small-conductance mechanosensitive channel
MQFVTTFGSKLERWARSFIFIVAFLLWMRATLRSFGLYEFLSDWFVEALEHKWVVGTFEISVNAIFDFILVLIVTFVLIRLIRAFMDLEIFPRLNLPKGLPAAISMMVRYIMIGLGIFLALAALGMDLGNVGILAGALGVGLGFGLQKIVANFISSLIIAFNRLIRVGDTVKYGETMGNVTDVGVNASTVRTFDGSEVLIPNADLISNKVTNWTLSDNKRRMEMPVKVAYGSDPHEVIKLLVKVAGYHPDVLQDPEPFAIFNGFQEHFLDFTLYYWIPTSAYFTAKNEIALSVHDILLLNKIDSPRPWRDISLEMNEKLNNRTSATKTRGQGKKTPRK